MPKDNNSEWETYSVYLEKKLVKEAKDLLDLGQKLSPRINDLLKKWVEEKKKEVKK